MSSDLQDAWLVQKVTDPASAEFEHMLMLLLKERTDDRPRQHRLKGKGDFRYTLPYRGEPEMEKTILEELPFTFSERSLFRNGVMSLAVTAESLLDLIAMSATKSKFTNTLCVTGESSSIVDILDSAGGLPSNVTVIAHLNVADNLLRTRPETLIFDHTTVNCPIDELLSLAYVAGVQVVDGVFPYHAAAIKGWDVVSGKAKWSYTLSRGHVIVGPDDDPVRLVKYRRADYKKFVDPAGWKGNARQYTYELRSFRNGLVTYRAVYTGDCGMTRPDEQKFRLPMTSDDDTVLVTINRALAAGVFASTSNNAEELQQLEKDYCIEVRKELFTSCVDYLIAKDKGADIVGEAIRYITAHNYVDLVDGVRIVRCASLAYADALCVAIVCAVTAYMLRYRLTNESYRDIARTAASAKMLSDAPFGALGRIAWMVKNYVSDAVSALVTRPLEYARSRLYSTDYIPGVFFDVYLDVSYTPDVPWDNMGQLLAEHYDPFQEAVEEDNFTAFLGDSVKTSAPDVSLEVEQPPGKVEYPKYVHSHIPDPEVAIQEVYDHAFPGNSTAGVQNVGELRRVKDVNVNTEFYGRVEINRDKAAPEKLHDDLPVRTTALPTSNTPLLDAVLACAKRNFNPPDLQMENDPWKFARALVDRFVDRCFVKDFKHTVGKAYRENPLTFNVMDYMEWKATRDQAYRSALEGECPQDIVELGLEKFDTIVKQRIKPKMSVSAQFELSQPQVIVSLAKKDTALFTSAFRQVFKRFDGALAHGFKSAGRISDSELSDWLTEVKPYIRGLPAVELDSSKYDKSQNLLARMIESLLFAELGLDPQVMEIFADSYVGKVSSRSLGLMFISAYQMKSGAPDTMLGNIVYNAVSAGESIGWEKIRMMLLKGDDNVVWLRSDFSPSLAVEKMSGLFNLEVKLIMNSVLYFSSGYIVDVGDLVLFAPDPLKIAELLGEGGARSETKEERYRSFVDRVSAFRAHPALPEALQRVVRMRCAVPDLNVVLLVDSLLSMASSRALYDRVVPT